jgi:hypothetical protein
MESNKDHFGKGAILFCFSSYFDLPHNEGTKRARREVLMSFVHFNCCNADANRIYKQKIALSSNSSFLFFSRTPDVNVIIILFTVFLMI